MVSTNRTGRVSATDYEAGTYEVTYFDRGQNVARKINAISNGEYRMPMIGQTVSVAHTSNDLAAATTAGTIWNETNRPAEGFKGLYRKEYDSQKERAYSRYDENTGVYTQYVDRRTECTCDGEIFDEAKGPISLVADGQFQAKSGSASISLSAKMGIGLVAGTSVSIGVGSFASIEAAGELSVSTGGKYTLTVTKGVEVEVSGGEAKITLNGVVITVTEAGGVAATSPSKINLSAPEIKAGVSTSDIVIRGKSLIDYTREDSLGGGTIPPKQGGGRIWRWGAIWGCHSR